MSRGRSAMAQSQIAPLAGGVDTADIGTGGVAHWLAAVDGGAVSRADLTDMALANALDPEGEGPRTFRSIEREDAGRLARHQDSLAKAGDATGPLSGLPVSIKDLFDLEHRTTTAGSVVRRDAETATEDADAVKRLRAAGAVIVGRTNMTEFAYSGLGLNPHYGTPRNPFDRNRGLIPGGSSSGAAVSVTDGMAVAAIGSDTGGSLRIPAALCGLVGFKPTQARMPMRGVFPLSETLDTIGPIARSVDCCARIDAVLSGTRPVALRPRRPRDLRLGVLDRFVTDDLDPAVAAAFESALTKLSRAGATVRHLAAAPLEDVAGINRRGGFAAVESYANLGSLLRTAGDKFDRHVAARILKGRETSAAAYIGMIKARAAFKYKMTRLDDHADAFVCPTVPVPAPSIASLEDDDDLHEATHRLMVRNPSIANLLDRPSVSIPCQDAASLPVGFMIIGRSGEDRALLEIAAALERVISPDAAAPQ